MASREIAIILATTLGVILLIPFLMSFWATGMMGPGMMGPGMMGPGTMNRWAMGGYGPLVLLLLLVGVALLVLFVLRRSASDAVEILKHRFARGEITREQYEEFKQVIRPS